MSAIDPGAGRTAEAEDGREIVFLPRVLFFVLAPVSASMFSSPSTPMRVCGLCVLARECIPVRIASSISEAARANIKIGQISHAPLVTDASQSAHMHACSIRDLVFGHTLILKYLRLWTITIQLVCRISVLAADVRHWCEGK